MTLFSKEELLSFNEMMLGRGMPVEEDGIGYNKADYGACSTYFYGLNDAQYADLSKRLIKYTKTQLKVDRDQMKRTTSHYESLAKNSERDGISVDIREGGVLVSFRYNTDYINCIKNLPREKRKYDGEEKKWIVSNEVIHEVLLELEKLGADIQNSVEYINSKINNTSRIEKHKVLINKGSSVAVLKFDYKPEIVEEIKKIDKNSRKYMPDKKMWQVNVSHVENLIKELNGICIFIKDKTLSC